jgi:branched-chain amino acid aminotransferase
MSDHGIFISTYSMNSVWVNGRFCLENEPVLLASNRGFKYGDGLFETLRIHNKAIPLYAFHWERLSYGLEKLQIHQNSFTNESLKDHVLELCKRNNCENGGRVRIAVYRENNNAAGCVIEAVPLTEPYALNKKGLTVGIYTEARKSCDAFSGLKSINYLPYVLANRFAEDKGLDEALVLNQYGTLCDGSKTNLFLVKDQEIWTPAMDQGCVQGVMRRYLIEELRRKGSAVMERIITMQDVLQADEVFLTNAIKGIRWVAQIQDKQYSNRQITALFHSDCARLFS